MHWVDGALASDAGLYTLQVSGRPSAAVVGLNALQPIGPVGLCSDNVCVQEPQLVANPLLSGGELLRGLTTDSIGEFAVAGPLGVPPSLHIYGLHGHFLS